MKLTALGVAAYSAWGNVSATAPLVIIAGTATAFAGTADTLGPRGIAVAFALAGALWRWYNFNLTFKQGTSGIIVTSLAAYILGGGNLPVIGETLKAMDPDSVPMWNGFIVGIFGLLIFGYFQDFMKVYAEKKSGGGK